MKKGETKKIWTLRSLENENLHLFQKPSDESEISILYRMLNRTSGDIYVSFDTMHLTQVLVI